jgi:putative FmdB family regulatory protein
MPMYDYKCTKCGLNNELHHGWHDKPTVLCTYCNEPMAKVIAATPVVFKGKGFYSTDK